MRIITGTAKGTRLETLEGLDTRPTAERVKEAVFSIMQFDIENTKVLDLFAGSGQMGLEALSRGAESCTFVDKNNKATEIVKLNAKKTKLYQRCKILSADYAEILRGTKEKYDIVFLDPPYALKIIPSILDMLVKKNTVNENGYVVCESDDDIEYKADGFSTVKFAKYGKIYITVLRKQTSEE